MLASPGAGNTGVPAGQNVFVAEFRRWRDLSGLSRSALATEMGYSRSYVSKVESGNEHASSEFAKKADTVLNTGGALWRAWREQEAHHAATGGRPEPVAIAAVAEPTGGLLVEHDHAELYHDGGTYRLTQRRRLINHGDQPITRYLIRISVDRYPGDPERSNELYRNNPLTWDEIN
ncbi:MAG: helix-turn-helix domain-containing protein, partial [Pseudonocardiaceae bacterium]